MSHTPGPWTVADHDSNGQRIVRGEHIEICTCWHHCVTAIEQEMEANAHLIAAAPDLFAALNLAIGWLDQYTPERDIEKMRAALKKARGE